MSNNLSTSNTSSSPTINTVQDSSNCSSDPILDKTNFLDPLVFFDMIQDCGVELTTEEKELWRANPKKKKHKHITHGDYHYSKIYTLAEQLYGIYEGKKNEGASFQKLSVNKSNVCHAIGKCILSLRYHKARADIHAVTDTELLSFINLPAYRDQDSFYFVRQADVLKVFYDANTSSVRDKMRYTQADRLRAILLLFEEDMREYIPFCLRGKDKSDRLCLDEWDSKRRRCYHLIRDKFTDAEVTVDLPEKWFDEDTKMKIDEKHGFGKWDEYTKKLNPNDPERISLPRTNDDMKSLIGTTLVDYNKIMNDYQKNTGGGDGNEALFVSWEMREEITFLNYDLKVKDNVYLTIIHMRDKQFNFPITIITEPIDPEFQIDDDLFKDDETPSTGRSTPIFSRSTIDSVPLTKERRALLSTLQEVVNGLKNSDDDKSRSTGDHQQNLVRAINETTSTIEKFEGQYIQLKNNLKDKKRKLGKCDRENSSQKKLLKDIEGCVKDVKNTKAMIKTLKGTLCSQRDQLQKLSATEETKDDDEGNDDSSISDDDSSAE
jgi:hypothetical protein